MNNLQSINPTGIFLRKLLFDHGLSASEFAQLIDVPQPTIHRIIAGKSSKPRSETLNKIAKYFKLSLRDLIQHDIHNHPSSSTLNTSRALSVFNIEEYFSDKNFDMTGKETIIINDNYNLDCFAIRLNDTSMEPFFSKDGIIIIDPHKTTHDRCHVLIQTAISKKLLFRQLIINGDEQWIKPLNPDLNTLTLKKLNTNDKIIGVIVEYRQKFH